MDKLEITSAHIQGFKLYHFPPQILPSFVYYMIHSAFARSYKSRGHEPFMCEGGRYVNVECREGDV